MYMYMYMYVGMKTSAYDPKSNTRTTCTIVSCPDHTHCIDNSLMSFKGFLGLHQLFIARSGISDHQ